eukprot:scaffold613_cov56-Attheya_sp.AAC.1
MTISSQCLDKWISSFLKSPLDPMSYFWKRKPRSIVGMNDPIFGRNAWIPLLPQGPNPRMPTVEV